MRSAGGRTAGRPNDAGNERKARASSARRHEAASEKINVGPGQHNYAWSGRPSENGRGDKSNETQDAERKWPIVNPRRPRVRFRAQVLPNCGPALTTRPAGQHPAFHSDAH